MRKCELLFSASKYKNWHFGGNLARSNIIKVRILYNLATQLLENFLHNVLKQIYTRMFVAGLFLTEEN